MIVCFIMALSSQARADLFLEVGVGVHPGDDKPEIVLENPIGIVEFGYRKNRFTVSYTHASGLFKREAGIGLNLFAIKYEVMKWKY